MEDSRVRALIVDDEAHALEAIAELLADESDVEVVGKFGTPEDALTEAAFLQPDVAFLDVAMPILDGVALARRLRAEVGDLSIVFVTAHAGYAPAAFDVEAIDYLVKPIRRERFSVALERVRSRRDSTAPRALLSLVYSERMAVRDTHRTTFVEVTEIDWIGAAGNYAELHTLDGTHLLRESISSLAARLDPMRFVRIHRSVVVNIDRIASLQPAFRGEQVVTLRNGTRLHAAAARVHALVAALNRREPRR